MVGLFSLTLFLSAALMFIVEPMIGKLLLPLLGGAPAVWNGCMMFYQAILLLGYGYAHLSTRHLSLRRQVQLHAVIVLVALYFLPIRVTEQAMTTVPSVGNPLPWLITYLAISTGLPLFAIAATAPLLQRWFSQSGHAQARDPYFLYAASNAGSMIGLLAYPLIIEPGLTLRTQGLAWLAGYAALAILTMICGKKLWLGGTEPSRETHEPEGEPVTIGRRCHWIILAFVPSSLMLGVTTYLTTDVAPFPLLWVLPLGLYLLTFILVFARRAIQPGKWFGRVTVILAILVVFTFITKAQHGVLMVLTLHLVFFFMATWLCHSTLARNRPAPAHLTDFYFCMSLGGVLGGIFNALVAPLTFPDVYEYPLIVLLACALRPREDTGPSRLIHWKDLAWGLAAAALMFVIIYFLQFGKARSPWLNAVLMVAPPALLAYRWVKRPVRFSLSLAGVYGIGLLFLLTQSGPEYMERNFFGVLRVQESADGRFRDLLHGTTLHGRTLLDRGRELEPTAYYHRAGPAGQFFQAFNLQHAQGGRVAVIGLGAGALASYASPTEDWTFYEIDEAVIRMARNPFRFPFLKYSRARQLEVIPGDARLQFRFASPSAYQVIVLDAFSSDSIPLHLITREAMRLYLSKLSDDGVLMFHISNRRLDLSSVVANLAHEANVVCLINDSLEVNLDDLRDGMQSSIWVAMARHPADLGPLVNSPKWRPLLPQPQKRLWTDDFSNVLQVMRW